MCGRTRLAYPDPAMRWRCMMSPEHDTPIADPSIELWEEFWQLPRILWTSWWNVMMDTVYAPFPSCLGPGPSRRH